MRLILPLFVLTMIGACTSRDIVYKESRRIPGGIWTYKDTLNYRFEVSDTSLHYNLLVDFEHADTFAYQNIYIKLYTLFPDGKRLYKACSFDLFNQRGDSQGKCRGGKCSVETVLQDSVYFNRPGQYEITMEQYMRKDSIRGINSIGFCLEKAQL